MKQSVRYFLVACLVCSLASPAFPSSALQSSADFVSKSDEVGLDTTDDDKAVSSQTSSDSDAEEAAIDTDIQADNDDTDTPGETDTTDDTVTEESNDNEDTQPEPTQPDDSISDDTDDTASPPRVEPTLRITGLQIQSDNQKYIELFNPSDQDLKLQDWTLQYYTASKESFQDSSIALASFWGEVAAQSSVLIAHEAYQEVASDIDFSGSSPAISQGALAVVDAESVVQDRLCWSASAAHLCDGDYLPASSSNQPSVERRFDDIGVPREGMFSDIFVEATVAPMNGGYKPFLNECRGIEIREIAANVDDDQQFVELYNASSDPVDIEGCLLQTNRSETTSYRFADTTLQPDEYSEVYIKTTGLMLTKTTSGTVYFLSSDANSEVSVVEYHDLDADTSWSYMENDEWRQTYDMTPGSTNVWQEFLACGTGYERSQETGRCRQIVVDEPLTDCGAGKYRSEETGRCRMNETTAGLVPCRADQYRSDDTNRCRNISLAGSTLKPCRADQYRSEETNRCRAIVSAASSLVPCRDDQYRSEETNRCRTIVSSTIPEAAFAVEPIADTASAFVGWWALGGVGAFAIGYAGWEWRREVTNGIRKLGAFFVSGK